MDSGKRKRPAADVAVDDPRRPARSRAEEEASPSPAPAAVTDDEVEEFFAILRRMRDVSRGIAAPGGSRPAPGAERPRGEAPASGRWSPKFAWEDFAPAGAGDGGRNEPPQQEVAASPTAAAAAAPSAAAEEERVAENGTPRVLELDLNAEPET